MRRTDLGGQDREVLTKRTSSMAMCGRQKGTAVGAVSGGGGRKLSVREGCTRRRGARGGDGEFKGSSTLWLDGSGNGSTVGTTGRGGRKEAPRWGWAPYIATRGGGRRAARR
jgi:hypothetical protein